MTRQRIVNLFGWAGFTFIVAGLGFIAGGAGVILGTGICLTASCAMTYLLDALR